jgi:transposase InsO family protein
MYLVIVDAHSKWPEVYNMNSNTTSSAVISKFADSFARFGIPQQLVTDNGPQFTSEEFKKFCSCNKVHHVCVSPYHPRSNGEAERFVRTFKTAMRTADLPPEHRLTRFLLQYRVTPHATTGVSPAESLQQRKLRTLEKCAVRTTTAEVPLRPSCQDAGPPSR